MSARAVRAEAQFKLDADATRCARCGHPADFRVEPYGWCARCPCDDHPSTDARQETP